MLLICSSNSWSTFFFSLHILFLVDIKILKNGRVKHWKETGVWGLETGMIFGLMVDLYMFKAEQKLLFLIY